MAPDIQRNSMELLEWLYDHQDERPSSFPVDPSSNLRRLYELVSYLADRQLVADQSTFGAADATILPDGIAAVERLRSARATPTQRARRAVMARTHLLWWLEGQNSPPNDLSGALAGLGVDDLGTSFTIEDINREVAYLEEKGLIRGLRTFQSTGLMRPALTADGRTCVTDFGGNVSEYLNAQNRGGSTTNNTFNVNGGGNNFAVGDHNTQNMTTGLDTTKVLEFARFVAEAVPALGLPADQQGALQAQVEELRVEAESHFSEPGVIRSLIDKVMTSLGAATSTALQTVATGLGDQALESIQTAITGG
jgi:hypothetical protein